MTETYQRPALYRFANEMETTLRKHDANKGDSWRSVDIAFLRAKLDEEIREYKENYEPSELVDIANICMMIWQRREW